MKKILPIILIFCIIFSCVAFSACSKQQDNNESQVSDTSSFSGIVVSDKNESLETFTINTPYGKIDFDKSLMDIVKTTEWISTTDGTKPTTKDGSKPNEIYNLTFSVNLSGKGETKVFDLLIGDGDGNLIGTLNEKPVKIHEYEVNMSDMSKDNTEKVYKMFDDINVVLDSLSNFKGFKIHTN